ncbi:zonular occludens toxin domain-containing protein [Kingella kingae]|uniref:zonular occludens toxin domain-containing protein n=1 Tax=Kingella kingae TaxID=504 RepID=UPI00254CB749|nr:zonular occludens toxin domain-containing protein [Kingella kingae]MDK4529095.1 zonular occludens toxin domain-containing protein [Kingella kingae]MDK4564367.1 zonular occludens toxin domain-containing protein [Kingella kingae]MDK4579054.1 zonular occludens toxin domain-containing protein [Kingella kingae]MDK4675139.1 zonular occludens toxin domain-containing protein [Kingella kingae]
MIYLITGTPGTGKTSMVVDMILNNYEGLFKTEAEDGTIIDRPLYFCHIDGLDAQKFKAHRLTEEQLQEKPLNEIVPTGSVIIVDECDYTYPVRSAARAVPPYVQTLKELRHEGFTLILMTQHPSMIDKYIRNLVGKHIHLERKQVGTMRYEWFRCEEILNGEAFRTGAGVFYTPPKNAFQYYKSSSKHIKFKKKRHWMFYVLPFIIILFFYKLYTFSVTLNNRTNPKSENSDVTASASFKTENVAEKTEQMTASVPLGGKLEDYVPRIEGMPETRPIYDSLRNPVNLEVVAACVSTKTTCNCYTDQATWIHVPDDLCRFYVKNGIFQRYKPMEREQLASVK